jgi:transposase InsO family protein
VSARYELIDAEKATLTAAGAVKYSIVSMCEWLDVSASGYYEWRGRPASATAARRDRLAVLIDTAFTDSDGTYGHRRIHAQLARWGEHTSPELVRALLRELGLVACQPRPWRQSLTVADAAPATIPDLVRRDFTAPAPGQKMVGDITYIPTWEGWLYLATVIDCHTKAVIGWRSRTTTRPRRSARRSQWPPATTTWAPARSSIPTAVATTRRPNSLVS